MYMSVGNCSHCINPFHAVNLSYVGRKYFPKGPCCTCKCVVRCIGHIINFGHTILCRVTCHSYVEVEHVYIIQVFQLRHIQ